MDLKLLRWWGGKSLILAHADEYAHEKRKNAYPEPSIKALHT
jgi:hypothetical protein